MSEETILIEKEQDFESELHSAFLAMGSSSYVDQDRVQPSNIAPDVDLTNFTNFSEIIIPEQNSSQKPPEERDKPPASKLHREKQYRRAIKMALFSTNPNFDEQAVDMAMKRLEKRNVVKYITNSVKSPFNSEKIQECLRKDSVQTVIKGVVPDVERLTDYAIKSAVMVVRDGDVNKEVLTSRQKKIARLVSGIAVPASKGGAVVLLGAVVFKVAPVAMVAVGLCRVGMSLNSEFQGKKLEDPQKSSIDIFKTLVEEGKIRDALIRGAEQGTGVVLLKQMFMACSVGRAMMGKQENKKPNKQDAFSQESKRLRQLIQDISDGAKVDRKELLEAADDIKNVLLSTFLNADIHAVVSELTISMGGEKPKSETVVRKKRQSQLAQRVSAASAATMA